MYLRQGPLGVLIFSKVLGSFGKNQNFSYCQIFMKFKTKIKKQNEIFEKKLQPLKI